MNHRWGAPQYVDMHTTKRQCQRPGCKLIRITRHEPENDPPHWYEYEQDGLSIGRNLPHVPKCREHT
jgi:hypothetical protein